MSVKQGIFIPLLRHLSRLISNFCIKKTHCSHRYPTEGTQAIFDKVLKSKHMHE
jgi:hypothetical protein